VRVDVFVTSIVSSVLILPSLSLTFGTFAGLTAALASSFLFLTRWLLLLPPGIFITEDTT
jgi:hypothetical protein